MTVTIGRTDIDAAVHYVLDHTRVSNDHAARGLLRHGVEDLDMSLSETVAALVELSNKKMGTTRAALTQWHLEQQERIAAEAAEIARRAETSDALARMVRAYPETRVGAMIMAGVSRFRPVKVTPFQADRWASQVLAEARCEFTEAHVVAAVRRVIERGWPVEPIAVGAELARMLRR